MDTKQQLTEIIGEFNHGMLITTGLDGAPRARPMALGAVDDDGALWFATSAGSGKMDEIGENNQVGVALQGGGKFVSISGRARTVREHGRMQELWNESWRPWFPGGPEDSQLVLLRVDPIEAEYWDTAGVKGMKYAFEALKAAARGERAPDTETDWHHKVEMR